MPIDCLPRARNGWRDSEVVPASAEITDYLSIRVDWRIKKRNADRKKALPGLSSHQCTLSDRWQRLFSGCDCQHEPETIAAGHFSVTDNEIGPIMNISLEVKSLEKSSVILPSAGGEGHYSHELNWKFSISFSTCIMSKKPEKVELFRCFT